jgi:hypothetical protein
MIRVHLAVDRWGGIVADHIAIDLALLRETSRQLGQVAETLGGARGAAHEDAQAVAQRDLSAAMVEFADNWRVHREHLIGMVSGGQKFVAGAVDAYQRLDHDQAASLDGSKGAGAQ